MRFIHHAFTALASLGNFPYKAPGMERGEDHPARYAPNLARGPLNSVGGTGTAAGDFQVFTPFLFNAVQAQVYAGVTGSGVDQSGLLSQPLIGKSPGRN